ncbi:hypothetical protein ACFWYW_47000 [Nonomuraea sp. NPDC059023]|uniref:hypothetical protein n=1 Tax=unclassified Nonomuraea TaxID=2593643 RepID=UPI00369BF2AD
MAKAVLIARDPATGTQVVIGPVFTPKGMAELRQLAAGRGLTALTEAPLTSKADFTTPTRNT